MSEAPSQDTPQQIFEIQKLYLKDVSFESPGVPEVFTGEWKPETNVQLGTETRKLQNDVHEVSLNITVTTTMEKNTAYLVELKQAGVFTLRGFNDAQLGHMLGSYCPNILFPFAREAIADLISKGGFPGFLLAPVNFDALYSQHLQQAASQDSTPDASPTAH
ncbi:MAG: protein-export chaperone SecB [Pseudomonadota bacterium]|nr:protein-export chaperone SecB [Pseudomonadota bacterium]